MPDALVERDGHTMIITMNRPKRYNTLTGAMLVRMYDAMVEACADDGIRSIILTGAGGQLLFRGRPARDGRRRRRHRLRDRRAGAHGRRPRHPL